MFPIKTFVSERRAANLIARIRWHECVYCPRCRAEIRDSVVILYYIVFYSVISAD